MSIQTIIDDLNPNKKFKKNREFYTKMNEYFQNMVLSENIDRPYTVECPVLTDEEIDIVNKIISSDSYPDAIKPLVDKLYQYMGPENLYICAINLLTLKLNRHRKYKLKFYDFSQIFLAGAYESDENDIFYYDKSVLPHELLHMASTAREKIDDITYYSGFRFDYKKTTTQRGINEGYTELLTRRIFFNEDYDTSSLYKPSVYALRMFELLYPSYRYMERDYFWANHLSPLNAFTLYGTVEEFFTLSKYLDFFAATKVEGDEDIQILKFMRKITARTYDDDLYSKALEIEEEYLESKHKTKTLSR